MVEKSESKDMDSDVEEVPLSGDSIDLSDENNDDDICEVEHLRKLFIGGLAGQTSEETLRKFYSKWGTVVDTVVMRDSVTRRSRGFGFVTYSRVAMVDKAQANRPHMIDGKTVETKRALPRPENQPAEGKKSPSVKKLFVGGIKDSHDETCLNEYFSEFGNVVSVKLLTDNITGKRRGFALVEYDDYDAVDKAILQKTHLVKSTLLDVRKSIYTQEDAKTSSEKKRERPETMPKAGQYQNNRNIPPAGPMGNKNMLPRGPPIQPHPSAYQGQQYAQQQYPPMPPYQQAPPPNYNQWCPSPAHQMQPMPPFAQHANTYPQQPPTPIPHQPPHPIQPQNYGGYSQAPMPPVQPPHPQSGNWNNYHPVGGGGPWNAPPQPPQPSMGTQPLASNWQNNQWGPPPPAVAPRPMPPGHPAPPTNWQQSPASHVAGPPQQHPAAGVYPQQQQHSVPPPPPMPNNSGNGYQQNYGGGPTKHSNMYSNRMNPYNSGPNNQYNNNPVAHGYGNGMPNGSKYRR